MGVTSCARDIRDTVSSLRDRDISVGIATGYKFDERGCIPGRYKSSAHTTALDSFSFLSNGQGLLLPLHLVPR